MQYFWWDYRVSLTLITMGVKGLMLSIASDDTAEILIWRHFRWSAFVAMDVQISESRGKLYLECKVHFACAQRMLRQMHLTNVSESIEAKYWVSWLSFDVQQTWIQTIKTALNSPFCAVTADSTSRWPHGKKTLYFRGVVWTLTKKTAREPVLSPVFSGPFYTSATSDAIWHTTTKHCDT